MVDGAFKQLCCFPKIDTEVSLVKDLFIASRRVWDPGLVQWLFLPWEAELI